MPNEFSKRTDPSGFDPDRGWFQITTDIASHLPFSAAVEANGFVFLSGQASVDAQGNIVPGSFEEQMRRALQNVTDILRSAGLGLENVVRVTSYVQIRATFSGSTSSTASTSRRRTRPGRRSRAACRPRSSSKST
jgi:enamine deaminase RidA (YjgF/YER057c/UK114 family)